VVVSPDYDAEGMSVQQLPGGTCAIHHCEVADGDFARPWTELMRDWLPTSGYQPDDRPCFERYHNGDGNRPGGKWIMDIYLPVRPL
jgi:AraC family transcriptional regulator